MSRRCARSGCANGAVATLSYSYADGIVFLENLTDEAHPMVHDMCGLHAASVTVPRGWELRDNWEPVDDSAGVQPEFNRLDLIGA